MPLRAERRHRCGPEAGRTGGRIRRIDWMSIQKPPVTLLQLNVVSLNTGALLHRVHDRNCGAYTFNPFKGSPTRFAPIYDSAGNCVPSLYAADTLEAAIHETIFHDIPAKAKRKSVPRKHVRNRAHVQWKYCAICA